jgi:hypothetical protein
MFYNPTGQTKGVLYEQWISADKKIECMFYNPTGPTKECYTSGGYGENIIFGGVADIFINIAMLKILKYKNCVSSSFSSLDV